MTSYTGWALLLLSTYAIWLVVLTVRSFRNPETSPDSFFLAGKNVGLGASILTFWATIISAAAIVGGAGFFYVHGIGNLYFALISYTILAVLANTVGRKLWNLSRAHPEIRSPIQLYLKNYRSPALELLFVGITLYCMVPYVAIQITGFARLLEGALGLPYLPTAAVGLGIIFLYSESGGIKNIIRTDVVQSLVTIVGCVGVAMAFLWTEWSFDLGAFLSDIDAAQSPSLLKTPGPQGFFTLPMLIGLAVMLSFGAISMTQNAQRFMMVKDESYLRVLMFVFPALGIITAVTAAILGLGGAVAFPGLESGDQVVGKVSASVPPILGAMATIGIIAATMSTADSILLSVGFVVSEQVYRRKTNIEPKKILQISRIFTLAVCLFAFIASIQPKFITLLVFSTFGGMLQLTPALLLGLYNKTPSKYIAAASVVAGFLILFLNTTEIYKASFLAPLPGYLTGFCVACAICAVGVLNTKNQ